MKLIQRILCPTDFSATSANAFHYADRLAQALGAELVVVHSQDAPSPRGISGHAHAADPQLDVPDAGAEEEDRPTDPHIREQLDAVHRSPQELPLKRVFHEGPAGDVICWLAQHQKCDLIVIGAHGRSGLTHLLFGSTTEYVLRHARCPVLAIRDRPANEPPLPEPLIVPIPAPRFM